MHFCLLCVQHSLRVFSKDSLCAKSDKSNLKDEKRLKIRVKRASVFGCRLETSSKRKSSAGHAEQDESLASSYTRAKVQLPFLCSRLLLCFSLCPRLDFFSSVKSNKRTVSSHKEKKKTAAATFIISFWSSLK